MLPKIAEGGAVPGGGPHVHKMIYDGNKNFWRTRESVDVRIIEHTDAKILEIISFSVDKHEESDRIFVNSEKLYNKLNNSELQEKVAGKREEYNRQRKRVPNDEIFRVLVRDAAVLWVLARLSPGTTTNARKGVFADVVAEANEEGGNEESEGGASMDKTDSDVSALSTHESSAATGTDESAGADKVVDDASVALDKDGTTDSESGLTPRSGGGNEDGSSGRASKAAPVPQCDPRFHVDLIALTGDALITNAPNASKILDFLVPEHPTNIEIITVVRHRKKASKQEFNAALRNLKMDSQRLNMACGDAQKKAGLAVSSVDGFKNFTMRNKYDPDTMTLAQWRWLKAGRRVILQNAVAAVTRRLVESGITWVGQEEGTALAGLEGGLDGAKSRRLKPSASTTKLPSLNKGIKGQKRNSMGALRRLTRGSREPRPLDDFSKALSGAVHSHVEVHNQGKVMSGSDSLPVL